MAGYCQLTTAWGWGASNRVVCRADLSILATITQDQRKRSGDGGRASRGEVSEAAHLRRKAFGDVLHHGARHLAIARVAIG
jgi:hypothetical protein